MRPLRTRRLGRCWTQRQHIPHLPGTILAKRRAGMDWFQFLSSLVSSLAWPVAVLVLGMLFKAQVKELLAKMTTFKGPGIEASFGVQVQEVRADAKQIQLEPLPAAQ